MFNRGQSNHLCEFLERRRVEAAYVQKRRQYQHSSDDEVDDSSSAPSVIDGSRIPIMVVQRQKYIDRMYSEEHYSSVDVPHYIWVEEGTRLTPALVSECVYDSIYYSLTKPKHREQLKECLEKQDLISFGTTMNLHHDGVSFSEQQPLMVTFGF
jgi:hypothetical protein